MSRWNSADHPNWGWGEYEPILTFNEAEILALRDEHWPYTAEVDDGGWEVFCHCHSDGPWTYFTIDHLIDALKENRARVHDAGADPGLPPEHPPA
jgi:hypothetical protein